MNLRERLRKKHVNLDVYTKTYPLAVNINYSLTFSNKKLGPN